MSDFRITCVTKPNRSSQHEHITNVGGQENGGWYETRDRVVSLIDTNIHTFHTFEAGRRAEVRTRPGPTGRYLQTWADGQWQNNLLSLPECRR
jgi:hypothetical protein